MSIEWLNLYQEIFEYRKRKNADISYVSRGRDATWLDAFYNTSQANHVSPAHHGNQTGNREVLICLIGKENV